MTSPYASTPFASFYSALGESESPRTVLVHALEQLMVIDEESLPPAVRAYLAGHAPRWREAETVGAGIESYVTRLSRNQHTTELAELAGFARLMTAIDAARPVIHVASAPGPAAEEY